MMRILDHNLGKDNATARQVLETWEIAHRVLIGPLRGRERSKRLNTMPSSMQKRKILQRTSAGMRRIGCRTILYWFAWWRIILRWSSNPRSWTSMSPSFLSSSVNPSLRLLLSSSDGGSFVLNNRSRSGSGSCVEEALSWKRLEASSQELQMLHASHQFLLIFSHFTMYQSQKFTVFSGHQRSRVNGRIISYQGQ